MTEIYRQIIDHPSAWTNKAINGKEGLTYKMTEAQLDGIDAALKKTRHLGIQEATRKDFSAPVLDKMLAELFDILQNGRGAVIIQGCTPARYTPEDFERIYWGFGTHWGTAVTQSAKGDKIGRVTFTPVGPENPTNRAYRSNEELTLHTDLNELVGLMCVQNAQSGGYSQLASSAAVHNVILQTRPELLPALYEGYYYASREAALTAQPVTPYKIPVFSYTGGKLSCIYTGGFMEAAAVKLGVEMPADLVEAITYLKQVAAREDIHANFMLQPGEISMFNNYTVMHSRTAFEDSAEKKRYLMRLWLNLPQGGRPVVEPYRLEANFYTNVHFKKDAEPLREHVSIGA